MHYRITFPADMRHIPPIRHLLVQTAMIVGFDQRTADHLQSIVDELCANAIEFGSQKTSEVVLEIIADEKSIKIACTDQGHGHRMTASEIEKKIQEPLAPNAPRGRGLSQIVKGFASEFDVRDRTEGGIIVTAVIRK